MSVEPEVPLVSQARFTTVTGGDPEFERELIEIFEDDVAGQVDRLEEAHAAGDAAALAIVAHRLKGACGNIGAARLQSRAKTIEQCAHNRDLAVAAGHIAAFRGEFRDTVRCFRGNTGPTEAT